MHFVHPLPWWLAVVLLAGAAALAFVEYRRPLSPLTRTRRAVLVALRVLTLLTIVLFLFRPAVVLPPATSLDASVAVLVDVSRSMRIADEDGRPRVMRATTLLKNELLPGLSRRFAVELYRVGDGLAPADPDRLSADARGSDLTAAVGAVRQRNRGRRVAGIVVLSDGGDTGRAEGQQPGEAGPPVFTIGIGSPGGPIDREILGVTAGEQHLDQASVDLVVTALSSGFGRTPFELRLLANGQVLETRRVVPRADRSPIEERFTVAPDPLGPTVYRVEIPSDEREAVTENNARTALVSPAGRKRRLLVIEGAPGFEHSFMKRAWARDSGLEVDSVVRKGKNAGGKDTFLVQAGAGGSAALASGFPARREDLFSYDALILANIDGDSFTSAQLGLAAEFVAERGGGVLVLGGRSFASRGLSGTPLEEVLPVELNDRRGGVLRASLVAGQAPLLNRLAVTADGENHPVMRIGNSPDEARKRWAALPPLASSALVGGPRPGATVLAVTVGPDGGLHPVVAVQRYGRGRSMIFAGEASWRWKMMLASTDRTHEFFWRQAARWLASTTPDPVAISIPDSVEPGDVASMTIDVRDAAFAPVPAAAVDVSLTAPGGEGQSLTPGRADAARGRFSATARPGRAGLYRIHAEARRGTTLLGMADRWMYVGGADREFADPRLNEDVLRRLARRSGGQYLPAADASRVVSLLESGVAQHAAPELRDLWHGPWAFALVVALLSAEWILRRRSGLR